MKRNCDKCGKEYNAIICRLLIGQSKFCSKKCWYGTKSNVFLFNDDGTVSIKMNNGKESIIDSPDYEIIKNFTWYSAKRGTTFYACNQKLGYLHRFLLKPNGKYQCDHRDGNGLNNRRSNLRICSQAQNTYNNHSSRASSGYKGVHWDENLNKWRVDISKNKKLKYLGGFKDKHKAAIVYNEAAVMLFGEFAHKNIIRR